MKSFNKIDSFTKKQRSNKDFELKKNDLDSPAEELPLNLSASYRKSIINYNPVKEIQRITIPVLNLTR